jgi:hypothetical protein
MSLEMDRSCSGKSKACKTSEQPMAQDQYRVAFFALVIFALRTDEISIQYKVRLFIDLHRPVAFISTSLPSHFMGFGDPIKCGP